MQMLAVSPKPLGTYTDDCGSGGSHRLCELGVNVGDTETSTRGDASIVSDELEDSYNLGISPARETAGNTIGGDFFGHVGDAPITRAEVQAERARPVQLSAPRWQGSVGQMLAAQVSGRGRSMRMRNGQMLATPLKTLQSGCLGETESERRLCEMGVNVGEPLMGSQTDAFMDAEGLEAPYNAVGISPGRETAGNTIGGDWFGHVGDAPVTRAEVQAA